MEYVNGIKWNTKTTYFDTRDNLTYSTGTFNSVKNISQLKSDCSEKVKNDRPNPEIKKFYGEDGQKEMIQWFKNNLKNKMTGTKGPKMIKPSSSGFFEKSLRRIKILSTDEVYKERRWGFNNIGPGYRSYPC